MFTPASAALTYKIQICNLSKLNLCSRKDAPIIELWTTKHPQEICAEYEYVQNMYRKCAT